MSDARKPFADRRLHFIGAGGCGMSGLALVARELGAHVTGSDAKQTIYTESLERNGVTELTIGHDIGSVPDTPAEVVFSSAIKPENIERTEARRKGLAELHRSGLLTQITALHETVAVGGAHGKSSTAALLAHVLAFCGKDPAYVVGALLRPPGVHAAAGSGGTLVIEGEPMRFRLHDEVYEVNQPGVHQLHNAALVVEVARRAGCAAANIRNALLAFPGLARRFELRGKTSSGARVYDDYAHHPVEVAAALAAGRQVARGRRVLAVFQPHLFSRTQQFQTEFLDALAAADLAWVEPVYPARENPSDWTEVTEQLAADVNGRAPSMRMSAGRDGLVRQLQEEARDGDVVMLIGAGDVNVLAEPLIH